MKNERGLNMDLKARILQNTQQYARSCNETALKSHNIKMKSPILFVLFGSRVEEGLDALKEAMQNSVLNAEGVCYLVIGREKPKSAEGIVYLPLPESEKDAVSSRKELGQLIENEAFLKELASKVTQVKENMMEKSRMFSFWEQMHICSVTMASDEENALLADVMIFIKNKIMQDFKQVFMDLFVLLEETTVDSSPLQKARAMSLFKELELYETAAFTYEEETEVLEDDLKLAVSHKGQLFDLVYILSDKKESGQKIEEAMLGHYETIAAINLLKNRENHALEIEEAREQFNLNVFEINIKEQAENRYCSSRLAKVKKPGKGIYLATAYHLFKAYMEELGSSQVEGNSRMLLEAAGLSDEKLEELVVECSIPQEGLRQFHSLISKNVSFNRLKGEVFREAEEELYGNSADAFFQANFVKQSEKALLAKLGSEKYKEGLREELINNLKFGPFALKQLQGQKLDELLKEQREKYQLYEKGLLEEIETLYERTVGECIGGKFGIFDKKYIYEVKDYLIQEIYSRKYKVFLLQLKQKALDLLQQQLEGLYSEIKVQLKKLENLEGLLKDMVDEANRYEEEYLVQNVNDYYKKVVGEKLMQFKKTRGEGYLHDEKMMGKVSHVLSQSEETILEHIFYICEKEILQDEAYFGTSFEEELLARANMLIDYEDKQVAAKSQLYDLLYQSLEENSKPCVHLDTTVSPHRYIEKYFFGDRESEFIQYAYKRDQSSRSYKIGTVNDARKTMIEKLQLMGGFKLQEMVFYTSALRYYEAYEEKGYAFHTEKMKERMKQIENEGV